MSTRFSISLSSFQGAMSLQRCNVASQKRNKDAFLKEKGPHRSRDRKISLPHRAFPEQPAKAAGSATLCQV